MLKAEDQNLTPEALFGRAEEALPASVTMNVVGYSSDFFEEREVNEEEFPQIHLWYFPIPVKPGGRSVSWMNINGIHKAEFIDQIGSLFGIHSLLLEDIMNREHRAKVEDFGSHMFMVLKTLSYNEKTQELLVEQISIVMGADFVLSFQEREGTIFKAIRDRIRNKKSRLRQMGADHLVYTLIDAIVDNYFSVLDQLQQRAERIEDQLLADPKPSVLEEIHHFKKELIFLRGLITPVREIARSLQQGHSQLIEQHTMIYLRDLYDHATKATDTINSLQESLSSMLDTYMSTLSNKMNEVMKILAVMSTIFIPLTFVASLYGMNFHHMPELGKRWGYPSVLGIMLILAVGMMVYFRKKRWL